MQKQSDGQQEYCDQEYDHVKTGLYPSQNLILQYIENKESECDIIKQEAGW